MLSRRDSIGDNTIKRSQLTHKGRNSRSLDNVFDTKFTSQQFFVELVMQHYEQMSEQVFDQAIAAAPICNITKHRCELIMSRCNEHSTEWYRLEHQIKESMSLFNSPNAKFGTWGEMYDILQSIGIALPPQFNTKLRNTKKLNHFKVQDLINSLPCRQVTNVRSLPPIPRKY